MAYVVEKITPADQEKILRDAACDPEKLKRLTIGFRDGDPKMRHWTIERKRDCYMLTKPCSVRTDAGDLRGYFFFKGGLYEISQPHYFGPEIAIIDLPPESQMEEFKQEVTASYMEPDPDDAIMPVFTPWKGE